MKESTARIGDGRTDGRTDTHDRTGSECFPSRWPEINKRVGVVAIFKNSCIIKNSLTGIRKDRF